jgi:hypothetical protein
VVPRTLSDCVSFPGVVYKVITGKPIVSEVAMAFRRHERAPAVRAFISYTKEMKRRMGKAEGKETTAASRTIYRLGSGHVVNCTGIFNSRQVRSRAPDQTK